MLYRSTGTMRYHLPAMEICAVIRPVRTIRDRRPEPRLPRVPAKAASPIALAEASRPRPRLRAHGTVPGSWAPNLCNPWAIYAHLGLGHWTTFDWARLIAAQGEIA